MTQVAFSRDSREHVDATLVKALAAGATEPRDPQDYGFMYARDFTVNAAGCFDTRPRCSPL